MKTRIRMLRIAANCKKESSSLNRVGPRSAPQRITITKTYNDNALFEDLKALCIRAGVKGPPVAVIRSPEKGRGWRLGYSFKPP